MYGFERFCQHAAAISIDGLILPDLPEHEFETELRCYHSSLWIGFYFFLVTPN